MKEFKGTKGPWHYDGEDSRAIFHPTEIGVRLAVVDHTFDGLGWATKSTDQWKYNAKLIAAAPGLLEALQKVYAIAKQAGLQEDLDFEEFDYMEAAINKAIGS